MISIIVPNYNHAAFLEQRLERIFNQTFQDFEVILLDDASTDESMEILKSYKNHPKTTHCYTNTENSGNPFYQWNRGLALAKGDFVWIAESDDFCDLTFLEKLLEPHIKNVSIAFSYCQSYRADQEGNIIGNWIAHTACFKPNPCLENFVIDGNIFIEKYLIHKNVIPNVSAVLFNRRSLEKITPLFYKFYMRYNADWFYYIQLLCNHKIAFVAETLNYFRSHNNSLIAKSEKESGWLKIYKMELLGRKKMMEYIVDCNPSNLNEIKNQAEIGNLKLKYLTAHDYVNSGKPILGIWTVRNHILLLKKVCLELLKINRGR